MSTYRSSLKAGFIPNNPFEKYGALVAWCPYCETVHSHGAAGGGADHRIENRGAHCAPLAASLWDGRGYDIDVEGRVNGKADVQPDAPMLHSFLHKGTSARSRLKLWEQLRFTRPAVFKTLLSALVGRKISTLNAPIRLPQRGARLIVFNDGGYWMIVRPNRADIEGHGILTLASALCGVPQDVVALRLIESALDVHFDHEAAIALEAVIADWVDRGSPTREVY